MRYLGIDFGTKKTGIAFSDEGGTLAFPYKIINNDKNLIKEIVDICLEKEVEKIVLGESFNNKMEENTVNAEIKKFKNDLEKASALEILLEKEFMTTIEARRYQEKKMVDDSAAALILQRFLDKQKNN